jgi:hypothetical protein
VISWSAVEGTLHSAAARSGGAVYVSGRPGGLIRLRGSVVVGTWTTGTPLATPEPSARTGPAVLRRAAMADAIFVIAAGRIEAVREENEPSAPGTGELALERALREVRRRLTRLEREGAHRALCPEIDRVRSSTHDSAAVPLTATERAVLELADGRHTLRDIAFRVNRGVFGVTLDVMHLLDARLLEVVPDLFEPAPTAQAPEPEQDGTPPVATLLAPRTAAPAAQPSPQPVAGALPRLAQRVPGANGVGGRSRAAWRPWSLRPDRARRAGREHDDEQ